MRSSVPGMAHSARSNADEVHIDILDQVRTDERNHRNGRMHASRNRRQERELLSEMKYY